MSSLNTYTIILHKKSRTAYLVDYEGIEYIKFLPHPDGDTWMTKEGVEILMDTLKIKAVEGKTWTETNNAWELEVEI